MANVVDKQTLVNGERNLVVKVFIKGEAAGSDEADTIIVNVSDLDANIDVVRIDRIQANLSGFSALLEWDATTDDEIIAIPDGEPLDVDCRRFGGIQNPKSSGYTGDILITTSGLTVAADEGYIILEMTKKT